jgi:hypothetical protein
VICRRVVLLLAILARAEHRPGHASWDGRGGEGHRRPEVAARGGPGGGAIPPGCLEQRHTRERRGHEQRRRNRVSEELVLEIQPKGSGWSGGLVLPICRFDRFYYNELASNFRIWGSFTDLIWGRNKMGSRWEPK